MISCWVGYPKSVVVSCGTKGYREPKNQCNGYPTTLVLGLYGVLWLLFKQDIEHRVRCPKNRTSTRCEPYIKKLPNVSHNPLGWAMLQKSIKKPNAKKKVAMNQYQKKGRNSTYHSRGTGIPCR